MAGENAIFVSAKVSSNSGWWRQPFHSATRGRCQCRTAGCRIGNVRSQSIQILGLQVRESWHLALAAADDLLELVDANILGRHHTRAIRAMATLAELREDGMTLHLNARRMRYAQREF